MKTILLIGLGSFIGEMVRHFISCFLSNSIVKGFLVNTLTFNLASCLFLGILEGLLTRDMPANQKLSLSGIGLCNGFLSPSA